MIRRPAATPAGWLAIASCTAFVLAAAAALASRQPPALALAPLAGLPVAAALHRVRRGPTLRLAAGVLAGILAGGAAGVLRGSLAVHVPGAGTVDGHLGRRPLALDGRIRESIAPGPAGGTVVDASRLVERDGVRSVTGSVLVPLVPGRERWAEGDEVHVEAAGLVAGGGRPGPRSAESLAREGIEAVAVSARMTRVAPAGLTPAGVLAAVRQRLTAAVDRSLPEPEATMVLGIAFGLHGPIDAALTARLQDAGLFHVVVVSGLKVIIVAGAIRAAARALSWPRGRTLLCSAAVIGAYVLLSGGGPAAVRSAAMAGVAAAADLGGRRSDPVPLLAVTAAVMVAADPGIWRDAGFQLSFLGTAGILLLAVGIGERLPGPRALAEPFAVTVAAQLATLPVMAGVFGVISIVGPLANAAVLPGLPVLIVLGGTGAILASAVPLLGWLPLQLAGVGARLVVAVATVGAALPGSALHLGRWPGSWTAAELVGLAVAGGAAIALRRARPRGSRSPRRDRLVTSGVAAASGVVAGAVVLAAAAIPDGRLHVTVLDVGASSAVLVTSPHGHHALVDTGPDPTALLTALGRVLAPGEHDLDLLVVTAGGRLALGGARGLAGRYEVDRVLAAAPLTATSRDDLAALLGGHASSEDGRISQAPASWAWDGTDWTSWCVTAERTAPPGCALTLGDRSGRALFLGALGPPEQEEMAAVEGASLRADLVVAPPGGALGPALLEAARPHLVAVPTSTAAGRGGAGPSVGRGRAPGGAAAVIDSGLPAAMTGSDGDLEYVGGTRGLVPA